MPVCFCRDKKVMLNTNFRNTNLSKDVFILSYFKMLMQICMVNDGFSDKLSVNVRMHQGSNLSPSLFIVNLKAL